MSTAMQQTTASLPKVQMGSPAFGSKKIQELKQLSSRVSQSPISTKRKALATGHSFRPRRKEARAVSVISFTGPSKAMATKREMQQFYFDKEQVRIYNNIEGAKATMDTFRDTNSPGPEHNRTRKLKAL